MITQKIKKIWILLSDSEYRRKYFENKRIKKIPRFILSKTSIFENEMKFVDSVTFLSSYFEIFEEKIMAFTSKNMELYIIDCGANIGLATIYFKKLFPNSKIASFEPNPEIFEVLKHNVQSFQFTNIELHEAAVWTENGEIDFHLEGGHSSRIPKDGECLEVTKVKAIDLNEFIVDRVDFLKIDIEGAENQVIKHISEKLNLVDNLFLEYHSHILEKQNLGEILEILKKAGFRYHIQPQFHSKQPFIHIDEMLGMDFQINIFAFR